MRAVHCLCPCTPTSAWWSASRRLTGPETFKNRTQVCNRDMLGRARSWRLHARSVRLPVQALPAVARLCQQGPRRAAAGSIIKSSLICSPGEACSSGPRAGLCRGGFGSQQGAGGPQPCLPRLRGPRQGVLRPGGPARLRQADQAGWAAQGLGAGVLGRSASAPSDVLPGSDSPGARRARDRWPPSQAWPRARAG